MDQCPVGAPAFTHVRSWILPWIDEINFLFGFSPITPKRDSSAPKAVVRSSSDTGLQIG
jgi:hypothetical protein